MADSSSAAMLAPQSTGLSEVLDRSFYELVKRPTFDLVESLIISLANCYDRAAGESGLAEFRAQCQEHPLHRLVLECPFTRRAFEKPRGYAGDAVMLDYIYRPTIESLSDAGRQIFSATTSVSSAQSIAWRRDHLGTEIAKTVDDQANPKILSVASGHLRELDVVRELTSKRGVSIDALDLDADSLNEAVNSYPDFNIHPINKSITHLLKCRSRATYDLIYSAGLFDYLSIKVGSALLKKLLELLKPDGRLIVGNYATDNFGRGYMEGMMDWSLLYRDETDMTDLIRNAETSREYRTYRDTPMSSISKFRKDGAD